MSLFVTSAALFLASGQSFVFSHRGRPATSIEIGPHPSQSISFAAEQLKFYIHEISGASIPVVAKSASGRTISLVSTGKYGPEGFHIACNSRRITITGGALRGVMYGCFALLEEKLGVEWLNPRVTVIPHRSSLALAPFSLTERPAFEYREPYFTEATDKYWAAHNRTNGALSRLDASVGGKVQYGAFVHTFASLVPPETYFKDHPEYYALVNGKRNPDQLELTNPEVEKIAEATVEKWIKDNPSATIFSVSQNDNWNYSQSPESLAIDKEEGAPSGLVLRFVNKIADAIKVQHPNVLIDTLAYQWTEQPPLITKPHSNVRVRIAPIGADYGHGLPHESTNEKPFQNLLAWSKMSHQLYIWSYATNFAHYLQPLPDLDEIEADIPFFSRHGVVGVFYEGDYAAGGGGSFAGLKSYLIAKLLWNPKLSPAELETKYLKGVYGAAAPFIHSWLAALQSQVRAKNAVVGIYDPPTAAYFTTELLKKGESLLDQALDKVAGEKLYSEEVERVRLGWLYLELERTPPTDPRYKKWVDEFETWIARFGIREVSEGGSIDDYLRSLNQRLEKSSTSSEQLAAPIVLK